MYRGSIVGGFGNLDTDGFNLLASLSVRDNKVLRGDQRAFARRALVGDVGHRECAVDVLVHALDHRRGLAQADLDGQPAGDDIVISRDGATVLIDPMSLVYMAGSEIDFVDNLLGQSFQIKNPNAVASCGCGTSFSV